VSPLEQRAGSSTMVALRPGAESLKLARRLVRRCVQEVGGDEALSYAAQLAVSEVVSAMFERRDAQVELGSLTGARQLELVIMGHDEPHRFSEGDVRRRLVEATADEVIVSVQGSTMTVVLRFEL
jgi:hypothetical protein